MGAVARAAIAAGGRTLGVIPAHLVPREARGRPPADAVVTETMHERKKVMFMNADAIVALPGGPGTLDELFEVLTWRQLGLHAKPVLLLNVGGYWDPLLALLAGVVGARLRRRELPRLPPVSRRRPGPHGRALRPLRARRPQRVTAAPSPRGAAARTCRSPSHE